MGAILVLRDKQRTRPVNRPLLRRLTQALLRERLGVQDYELGLHLVEEREMTALNEAFLRHQGSTDVITFDYGEPCQPKRRFGDIFICVDEAVLQARRFHTSWQHELVRYVVHGLLHLSGYDDQQPAARRQMKRTEDRLVAELSRDFEVSALERPSRTDFPTAGA